MVLMSQSKSVLLEGLKKRTKVHIEGNRNTYVVDIFISGVVALIKK
jgi:hypothetical protein